MSRYIYVPSSNRVASDAQRNGLRVRLKKIMGHRIAITALLLLSLAASGQDRSLPSNVLSGEDKLARDIFRELIEINTTHSIGSTGKAASAMRERLKSAGFPDQDIQIVGPKPEKMNLVARIHGSGRRKPLLLISHLDVVEAKREDWTTDPFQLVEKDGYFYGRGTIDIKSAAAILIANFMQWRQMQYQPDRDLILALTADEEGGGDANGIEWLLKNRPELIAAEYCINPDGGEGKSKDGKRLYNSVQLSEKGYLTFQLEVKNKGGHSSLPTRDNAIYELAQGLVRLAEFDFPVMLNEATREYFKQIAARETPENAAAIRGLLSSGKGKTPSRGEASAKILAQSAAYNAQLRTTCVATMLEAGHAESALPQSARATVNCRILPGHSAAEVQSTLQSVLADDRIKITAASPIDEVASPASPLDPVVMGAIQEITVSMWPGVPVVPTMSAGATDGYYLRRSGIPTFGVSGIFEEIDDNRAHGKDERVSAQSFYEGREFLRRLIEKLSGH